MKIKEFQHQPVQPDTYEASMALNQLMRIGKHALKLHNMIDDAAEMESWVAKKIDLAGDYVKKVYNYTEGDKAGLYDDGGMSEMKRMPKGTGTMQGVKEDASGFKLVSQAKDIAKKMAGNYTGAVRQIEKLQKDLSKNSSVKQALLQFNEDAGEGHMSKSTLYHTAKYAIALMDMIKPGDDLEGWVQSKLNKAADYLQGVANYEEYQKLNPYREELDSNIIQKHAGIVQKHIDEILAKETKIDDIDTKPGMMRILSKRVNEVEKEMAKENRKNTDEAHGGQHTSSGRSMTKGEMNKREKIVKGMKKDKAGFKKRYGKDAQAVMYATATKQAMKDDDANESGILYRAGVKKYGKAGMQAIQSAAGKGASHQEIGKIKDKHLKDSEELEEGLKDWARNTAMAGVIVAGLAGIGSINDAIDKSIPAIGAMETALEMAQDSGDDNLAKMIEKDLSDAKIRLNSGKDLSYVKDLQSKYAKFIKTEGLAYESKLAIQLNQQLK